MFSTKLLRQLPSHRPIKTIPIWLTKQIKILKKDEAFPGKFPWWSIIFINSHGNITEAGLQHLTIFLKNLIFSNCRAHYPACRAHRIVFFCSWDAFLVSDRKPLLYSLSEPAPNRNLEQQLQRNYPPKKCIEKLLF